MFNFSTLIALRLASSCCCIATWPPPRRKNPRALRVCTQNGWCQRPSLHARQCEPLQPHDWQCRRVTAEEERHRSRGVLVGLPFSLPTTRRTHLLFANAVGAFETTCGSFIISVSLIAVGRSARLLGTTAAQLVLPLQVSPALEIARSSASRRCRRTQDGRVSPQPCCSHVK